jgi:hypothetical protein
VCARDSANHCRVAPESVATQRGKCSFSVFFGDEQHGLSLIGHEQRVEAEHFTGTADHFADGHTRFIYFNAQALTRRDLY